MRGFFFLPAALVALFAVACMTNSSNPKVIGGNLAKPQQFPAVVNLLAFGTKDLGICTGTFISKNQILTAAHCLLDSSPLPAPPKIDFKTRIIGDAEHPKVFFATGTDSGKTYTRDVRAFYFPEGCIKFLKTDPRTWESDKLEDAHDLAVLELTIEAPPEVMPAALFDGEIKSETSFQYVGYGAEASRLIPSDAPVFGTPHSLLHPLKFAVSKVKSIAEARVAFGRDYHGSATQSAAPGDSGGPVYVESLPEDEGKPSTIIMGVTSFVPLGGARPAPSEIAFTMLSPATSTGQWLRSVLQGTVKSFDLASANR